MLVFHKVSLGSPRCGDIKPQWHAKTGAHVRVVRLVGGLDQAQEKSLCKILGGREALRSTTLRRSTIIPRRSS